MKSHDRGFILHTLPKDADRQKLWIAVSKRGDPVNVNHARVCSRHFTSDDYEEDSKFRLLNPDKTPEENPRRRLKPTAVPSRNIPSREEKK